MMPRKILPLLVLLIAWQPATPRLAAQDVITAKNFAQMFEMIKPTAAESTWAQISWIIDLNEARKKAAAEGKPLFVWTMAGEPLGTC